MGKKKIFIGSSSEELELARKIKSILVSILNSDFEVIIWDEDVWEKGVFKVNQNYLSDLLKASLKFDFGILLGTTDDKVFFRGEEKLQPRDNVLFELGLFAGRLGFSKCAFLVENKVKIPTDLQGISMAFFEKDDESSIEMAVKKVVELFTSSQDDELNFFPSATLAAVYYANFVHPVCRYIIENGGLDFSNKKYTKCILNIIVPKTINEDVNLQFQILKNSHKLSEIDIYCCGRTRKIVIDVERKKKCQEKDCLYLIDFPTIIAGIDSAISALMPDVHKACDKGYSSILNRELDRFVFTLNKLVKKAGYEKIVFIEKE